jgi:hypothetical protein
VPRRSSSSGVSGKKHATVAASSDSKAKDKGASAKDRKKEWKDKATAVIKACMYPYYAERVARPTSAAVLAEPRPAPPGGLIASVDEFKHVAQRLLAKVTDMYWDGARYQVRWTDGYCCFYCE